MISFPQNLNHETHRPARRGILMNILVACFTHIDFLSPQIFRFNKKISFVRVRTIHYTKIFIAVPKIWIGVIMFGLEDVSIERFLQSLTVYLLIVRKIWKGNCLQICLFFIIQRATLKILRTDTFIKGFWHTSIYNNIIIIMFFIASTII